MGGPFKFALFSFLLLSSLDLQILIASINWENRKNE